MKRLCTSVISLALFVLAPLSVSTGFAESGGEPGAVYALTNAPAGNAVVVFNRAADGSLTPAGSVPTGGLGTGGGLGSQGAVILSHDQQWLFAVNAGSDEISSFAVEPQGLRFVGKVASGGIRPTSLTIHQDLLYVLNAGGSGNITGFTVDRQGGLTPLPGSTRPLSGNATNPAQVQFSPDGTLLIVTERATNLIDTYTVGSDGQASGPVTHPSAGTTPFGFAFGLRDQIFVSEAGQRAVSWYQVTAGGDLIVVSGSVPTGQIAACWIAVTQNGRFAYTTNAGSASVSGYRIAEDGSLSLITADGRTGLTGQTPTDLALSKNSRYLYSRNAGDGTISAFQVQADGNLSSVGGASGLLSGAAGLAAR